MIITSIDDKLFFVDLLMQSTCGFITAIELKIFSIVMHRREGSGMVAPENDQVTVARRHAEFKRGRKVTARAQVNTVTVH